ncbi:hypothetical protein PFICI_13674 [Pestalotiopsis fici W106-1]|uniref:NB-ARC domain-containing protein n=1 Tax=Pestalotiopsis fici (strain W106-1 / CGMCC3.15140) TaxID=1229662 RepID=W3WMQ4_PESFW|nr:uncharacterized protein PFICI_13674 [Pestalotiopsis fici W106-1]ETS75190.1 hypothetical protein PFICI_13674 [Pestalotiopsis fici W106-1]
MAESDLKPLRRHDYHVAWICPGDDVALDPARLLFDEEHPRPEFDADYDDNTYYFGTMGGHNVVLATTSPGMRGNVNASRLTSPMFKTFPNIKMTMVVGIGGGVPSESPADDALKDIHLGDVIVGWPGDGKPAVVYYESGRSLVDGFEQLGQVDKPDWVLLQALAKIKSDHRFDTIKPTPRPRTGFRANLNNLQQYDPQYAYPGYQHDKLFRSGYNHQGQKEDCADCASGELIDRKPREERHQGQLVFHQGRIGTGNSVILDGQLRDQISRENGGLQCIEMSAAGVDASRNCLVIRGISDYCDSHKGSAWKHYAAASAAVFGRELLSAVQPKKVTGMEVGGTKVSDMKIDHFMVPLGRNDGFVERQDIVPNLLERVLPSSNRDDCQRNAIEGLGGIGKTQIALELAYRARTETSVFWIPAMSQASFDNAVRGIGRLLNVPGMEDDQANHKDLVKAALEKTTDDWILIIDNADDMNLCFDKDDGLRLSQWLPFNRNGSILFTTRDHEVPSRLDISSNCVVKLAEMSKDEAIDLLKTRLDETQLRDVQSTNTLIDRLAYLPLAIKQASAYMAQTGDSTSTYLRYHRESNQEQIELLSRDFEDQGRYPGTKNAITTTWLISFEHVSRKHPLAIQYLEFICFLAQKDIPKSLLPPASTEREQNEAVATLQGYAFITRRDHGNSFDIHRLVQLAMRNHLQGERLRETTTITIQHLSKVYPFPKHENRSLWMQYMPHVMAAAEVCREAGDKHATITFLHCVAETYRRTSKYKQAEHLFQQELELAEEMYSQRHPETLACMYCLAISISRQGRYGEAEEMHRQRIKIEEEVLGKQHRATLASRLEFAQSIYRQGRYGEAEQLYRNMLKVYQEVLGKQHSHTLTCMQELTKTIHAQGRYSEAEQMHRNTLKIHQEVSGQQHRHTLTCMQELARSIHHQGRYSEAEQMHREILEVRQEVSGQQHPHTLTCMQELARSIHDQGRYSEAEQMHREISEVRQKVLGQQHPDTLNTMHWLAVALDRQEKWGEAEQTYRQALALMEKALGPEHDRTIGCKKNLQKCLESSGKSSTTDCRETQKDFPEHEDTRETEQQGQRQGRKRVHKRRAKRVKTGN